MAESEVLNPSILDCAMAAEDEMSASAIVPSLIFAEVIEASAIEVFNPVRPDPSPTNAVAETVPVVITFVILLFPNVMVFDPLPVALYPITISFCAPSADALVSDPRYTE